MKYPSIFERELTTMRPEGGMITALEIIQRDDAKWQINVNLSWKTDSRYTVYRYNVRRVKLYARLSAAIQHVLMKYQYDGVISVRANLDVVTKSQI
jgi:hypothetical protein